MADEVDAPIVLVESVAGFEESAPATDLDPRYADSSTLTGDLIFSGRGLSLGEGPASSSTRPPVAVTMAVLVALAKSCSARSTHLGRSPAA